MSAKSEKNPKAKQRELKKIVDIFSKIVAGNHELFQVDLDTKKWTSGPQRFAQIPDWHKRGNIRPRKSEAFNTSEKGFTKLKRYKKDKDEKFRPFKDLVIYPSIDPYFPEIRAMCRLLMEENPIILEGSEILQQLVITDSTRSIQPRDEVELPEGTLDAWEQKAIWVPYWEKNITPKEILKWVDGYCKTLDFDSLLFDAYLFVREQGRTCIGMFPLERNKTTGLLPLPKALKIIRPELLRRPIVNLDTGELAGVEVSNLTSNGSILDAKRCVYINYSKNLELFGDFYGRIPIRSLIDVGKVILFIFGRDWIEAVLQTWHTKPIFKHTLPSKDWSKVKPILEEFNLLMEQSINKTISVSNNVELLNPNGTDSGDIAGINQILEMAIKVINGFDNIPLFMVGHGETGNLGGNANREEVDAFLKTKIKPQQQMFENIAKDQFYDRVLAVLWNLEPEDVDQVPLQILHNFEKPNISVPFSMDEWNVHMFLVDNNYTTMEQVMEHFGLRHMMTNPTDLGTDTTPASKTFNPHIRNRHPSWNPQLHKIDLSRPLKRNFSVGGHQSINEMTSKKGELIDAIKQQVSGGQNFEKLKKRLHRDFKIKEQQMISRLDKERVKLAKEREKIAKTKK